MAGEGRTNLQYNIAKGNFADGRNLSFSFDQAGTHFSAGVQNIGTTAESISIGGDVATLGYGFFRNLDATNYVELGITVSATFYPFLKLLAGEAAAFRLSAVGTLYARANTAAVDLEYRINEA